MDAVLEARQLTKRYADVLALDHLDLTARPSEPCFATTWSAIRAARVRCSAWRRACVPSQRTKPPLWSEASCVTR